MCDINLKGRRSTLLSTSITLSPTLLSVILSVGDSYMWPHVLNTPVGCVLVVFFFPVCDDVMSFMGNVCEDQRSLIYSLVDPPALSLLDRENSRLWEVRVGTCNSCNVSVCF